MKKSLLALLAVPLLFTSCYININTHEGAFEDYSDEENYEIGNADFAGEVSSLVLDWVAGNIYIDMNDSENIVIEETSSKNIDEDMQLRYRYDEKSKSLVIKYCRPKQNFRYEFTKDLTLKLPAGTVLKTSEINCTSGEITSKNIGMSKVEINKTTGDLAIELPGTTDELKINSTTSDLMIESDFVKKLEINSTTGNIDYYADSDAPDKLEINSTTGNVNLYLPENNGFTLEANNIFNKVKRNDFSTTSDGNKYIYKDGKKKFEISITSGKIYIYKNNPPCCK